jgi:hypothetical protein
VNLTGLPLNSSIYYSVGDAATGASQVFSFLSNPGIGSSPAFYPFTTAFVADVGESEGANNTIQRVLAAKDSAAIRSVVINGDISYATGEEWMHCLGCMGAPVRASGARNPMDDQSWQS